MTSILIEIYLKVWALAFAHRTFKDWLLDTWASLTRNSLLLFIETDTFDSFWVYAFTWLRLSDSGTWLVDELALLQLIQGLSLRLLYLLDSASDLETYLFPLWSILVSYSLIFGVQRLIFLVIGLVLRARFQESGRRLNRSESLHKVYVNLMN